MLAHDTDYGDLLPMVKAFGWLISAGWAALLAWGARSKKWRPVQEELPGGSAGVALLLTAVALGLLWFEYNQIGYNWLLYFAGGASVAALMFFLLNNLVLTTFLYDSARAPSGKVVGGFWLSREATKVKREQGQDVGDILKGMEYVPRRVWPPFSIGLAKLAIIFSYVAFTVSGSAALACGGLAVLAGRQPNIQEFSTAPLQVKSGEVSTLRWRVTNATSVELRPLGTVAPSGDRPVRPTQDTAYTLAARNSVGSKSVQLGIVVSAAPVRRQIKKPTLAGGLSDVTIQAQARDCSLVKNAVIRGEGWLQSEADGESTTASCELSFAHAGSYELFVTYASDESRPIRITLNNFIIQEKGLAPTTGGWSEPNTTDQSLGVVSVSAGKNTLQFYSEHPFPHIQQVRFRAIQR